MAIIKCKMCGGDLDISEGMTVAECEYCGTKQTVPTAGNEKKLTLFARANRLRLANEFDKAAGVYESVVAEFPEEAEAYWGLVLCRYGIEYVDDPATGKKIPTCHRSSFDSVMEDVDFEQACENADAIARRQYREEAKQIEEIRKGIIEVSGNEAPYDIFICYKETDENGERTLDSVIAQDVYDALTEKGYRVFFSRISLEDKLGTEYEPYIFAALNSAKVMLAFGTDYEHYNAPWVKNEWSRFLKLMAEDKSKHLIPCYKDIGAYDMPKEFVKLQALDMGKVGATQDLMRGIEKLLPRRELSKLAQPVQQVVQQVVHSGGPNVEAMLRRGQLALEDSEWDKAKEHFDKALDMDAECAAAYYGLLLADLKVSNTESIPKYKKTIQDVRARSNYSKYKRFAASEDFDRFEDNLAKAFGRAAEQMRQKELARAEQINIIKNARQRIAPVQHMLSAGGNRTFAITVDGTLYAVGTNDNGECIIGHWKNIEQISAGNSHTIGLKNDGTVVAVGKNDEGQCDVSHWKNITAVSAGYQHTLGLKTDGTAIAVGYNKKRLIAESGPCDVFGNPWSNLVSVAAGSNYSYGITRNGAVLGAGNIPYRIENWADVIEISCAGDDDVLGLKADGTVSWGELVLGLAELGTGMKSYP